MNTLRLVTNLDEVAPANGSSTEQTRTDSAGRPSLADFGEMLAESVLTYEQVKHPDGSINRADVAQNALYRVGMLAGQLADTNISIDGLRAVMEVIDGAIETTSPGRLERARQARASLIDLITLAMHVIECRAELWQFAEASENYDKALTDALYRGSGACASTDDRDNAQELETARKTIKQYADEIEAVKGKLKRAEDRARALTDYYNHLFCMVADRLSDEEREAHAKFKAEHFRG